MVAANLETDMVILLAQGQLKCVSLQMDVYYSYIKYEGVRPFRPSVCANKTSLPALTREFLHDLPGNCQ